MTVHSLRFRASAVPGVAACAVAAAAVAFAAPASASSLDVNAAVAQMNAERAKVGCPSLGVNEALNTVAHNRSVEMAKYSSVSAGGGDLARRLSDAGYSAQSGNELVLTSTAAASTTDAVGAWLAGNNLRGSVLNCRFTHVGVGLASGPNSASYWTAVFARPK